MDNFRADGTVLKLTLPDDPSPPAVVGGQGYVIDSVFVVATKDSAVDDTQFEALVEGVVILSRVDDEDWSEGDKIHWDDANKVATTQADDGGSPATTFPVIGVAVEDIAASPATATGKVLIDGVAR